MAIAFWGGDSHNPFMHDLLHCKKATKMLTEVMAWPKVNPLVFIEVNRFLIDKARIGFYQMTIAKSTDWLPQIVSVLTSIVQAMSTGLVHSLHLD